MYRRLRKGMSPFSPDRQHIHHLIMRAGFTSRQAFVLITLAAALLASIGVLAEYSHFVPEWVMLVLFLLAFSSALSCASFGGSGPAACLAISFGSMPIG